MYLYRYLKDEHAEIWIPRSFSDHHPSEAQPPPVVKEWQGVVDVETNVICINSLSHVTHDAEADSIREKPNTFIFNPKPKVGKSPRGKDGKNRTYQQCGDKLKIISTGNPVYPGWISWWGISSTNCRGTDIQRQVQELKKEEPQLREANFLKDKPDSRYGKHEFIISFQDLLTSYTQSRTDCIDQKVCLKNAGTLRYKYEICYVIMLAMEGDVAIQDFPSMYGEPLFQHNGLIDNNGRVIDRHITPNFILRHLFTHYENHYHDFFTGEAKTHYINHGWETLAFALFFPKNKVLECSSRLCNEEEIDHCPPCSKPSCPVFTQQYERHKTTIIF